MRLVFTIVAALVLAVASGALADSTSGNKLQCFSGSTDGGGFNGTCTLTTSGAELNTIDNDADPNNNYAGVYVQNTNLGGKLLGHVNKLAFSYEGTSAVEAPRG